MTTPGTTVPPRPPPPPPLQPPPPPPAPTLNTEQVSLPPPPPPQPAPPSNSPGAPAPTEPSFWQEEPSNKPSSLEQSSDDPDGHAKFDVGDMALRVAVADVWSEHTGTNWLLLTYEPGQGHCQFDSKGTGGYYEMVSNLELSQVQHGLFRFMFDGVPHFRCGIEGGGRRSQMNGRPRAG